jgi:enoyl-CoA hydratase
MSFVNTETRDGICILRLDHGKPNSISKAVSEELIAALDKAEESAGAVVLLGKPGMFSAGFDLPTMAEGPAAAAAMVHAGGRLLMSIYNHPKPIVVGCTGHAIAMGVFMVMAGDYRIGAKGSFKLGANETAIGMTLPTFGIELARTCLSKRHYDRAIVQSTIYDPQGAVDAGFLDCVVEPDRVEAEALEVAARLAQLKQPAFRNNKQLAHGPTVELITSTLDANIKALMPS